MLAGFINAFSVVVLVTSGAATTGVATLSGVAFGYEKNGLSGLYYLLQIFAFMVGSTFGGVIAPARRMRIGLPYGIALMIEGALLASSTVLLRFDYVIAARLRLWLRSMVCSEAVCYRFPIALAMGLQNGLATYYSNAVIRLTHISGMCSDIGMILGEAMRRREWIPDLWKVRLETFFLYFFKKNVSSKCIYRFLVLFSLEALLEGEMVIGSLLVCITDSFRSRLLSFEPMFLAIPAGILFCTGLIMSIGLFVFIKTSLAEEKDLHIRKCLQGFLAFCLTKKEEILFPSPPPLDEDDAEYYSSEDMVRETKGRCMALTSCLGRLWKRLIT